MQDVVALTAMQRVVAFAAIKKIVAVPPVDQVVALATKQGVVAFAAVQRVVAAPALDEVVAPEPFQKVALARADQRVVALGALARGRFLGFRFGIAAIVDEGSPQRQGEKQGQHPHDTVSGSAGPSRAPHSARPSYTRLAGSRVG